MLRKILKITLIVICIGFASAFIRGFTYQNNKSNEKKDKTNQVQTIKQELIDEEIISSILNSDEELEETNNPVQEEQKTDKKKLIIQM